MTTPNIEELPAPETLAQMAEACETLTSLMLIIPGIDTGAWAKTLREADASMQSQAERIKVLEAELSHTDVLLEECKMDWSGDVTQIKAEHKREVDTLRAQAAPAVGAPDACV